MDSCLEILQCLLVKHILLKPKINSIVSKILLCQILHVKDQKFL